MNPQDERSKLLYEIIGVLQEKTRSGELVWLKMAHYHEGYTVGDYAFTTGDKFTLSIKSSSFENHPRLSSLLEDIRAQYYRYKAKIEVDMLRMHLADLYK